MLLNYELIKNDVFPVVITKDDRVKYFEFIDKQDITGFAEFLKDLSKKEEERILKFGYNK